MKTTTKYEKIFPNPANITKLLGIEGLVVSRIRVSGSELSIETNRDMTQEERGIVAEFLKTGLNSVWQFMEAKPVKKTEKRGKGEIQLG